MSSLKQRYDAEVFPALQKEFQYSSPMQVPRIKKIVLNMRVGDAVTDKKSLVGAEKSLTLISGQKPVLVKAKKSVASFKIRKGFPIGYKVTLRKKAMWNFLDRLVQVALPRIRDFRGLSSDAFDAGGNYNVGICEHIIFPEIEMDDIDKIRGFDIAIVMNAGQREASRALLAKLGFPFRHKSG